MNCIRIALFAIVLIMTASPALAAPASLGVAGNYNGFIFNNFTGYSDTQGRLAVGGNGEFWHYSVGDKLPANNTGDVLVVGGDLHYRNGRVYNGDIRVGGRANVPGYMKQTNNIYSHAAMPFDFNAEQQRLTNLSSSLAGLAATGTVSNEWGGLKLTGTGQGNTHVFNIDGMSLLGGWGLDILSGIGQNDTVLINVSGDMTGLTNMNMESLQPFSSKILFNFYEATNLMLNGVAVWGSILAPLADITLPTGVLNGTLIANSFNGPMQLNHNPFTGTLPSPTPIPGSLLLMGTGLLGLVSFRKRR